VVQSSGSFSRLEGCGRSGSDTLGLPLMDGYASFTLASTAR
jgi:hypothetical protein